MMVRLTSMRRGRWLMAVAGGVCALAVFAVASMRAAAGCGAPAPAGADLAVVMLAHPDKLVVVDLERMRVVTSVALRSLPMDLLVDRDGRAVTAQSGGVGDDADDAVGVYDVRGGGPVRYVRLADRNPTFMVSVGREVFVTHGVAYAGGMGLSVVDPGAGRTVRSGLFPDGPGRVMAVSDRRIWTLEYDKAALESTGSSRIGPPATLTAVDPMTLARNPVGPLRAGVNQVIAPRAGTLLLLSGTVGAAPAAVTEVDPATGADRRSVRLPALRHGAMQGCLAGQRLVVSEWDGLEAEDEGEWIEWLDSRTLTREGGLRVPGGPCAVAGWGDRIVVVERATGSLLVVDPASGRVTGRVRLVTEAPVLADVQVLEGG